MIFCRLRYEGYDRINVNSYPGNLGNPRQVGGVVQGVLVEVVVVVDVGRCGVLGVEVVDMECVMLFLCKVVQR